MSSSRVRGACKLGVGLAVFDVQVGSELEILSMQKASKAKIPQPVAFRVHSCPEFVESGDKNPKSVSTIQQQENVLQMFLSFLRCRFVELEDH